MTTLILHEWLDNTGSMIYITFFNTGHTLAQK